MDSHPWYIHMRKMKNSVKKHVQSPEHIEKWGSAKNHEKFLSCTSQWQLQRLKGTSLDKYFNYLRVVIKIWRAKELLQTVMLKICFYTTRYDSSSLSSPNTDKTLPGNLCFFETPPITYNNLDTFYAPTKH